MRLEFFHHAVATIAICFVPITTMAKPPVPDYAGIKDVCKDAVSYVTCAYVREVKAAGKVIHAALGDKGLHYQLAIYNKNTGKLIATYGKTTSQYTPVFGQGKMLLEKPSTKDGYNPIPKWCVASSSISVRQMEHYIALKNDCREYADRIREDLIENHGGKDIAIPKFAYLDVDLQVADTHDSKVTGEKSTVSSFKDASTSQGRAMTDEEAIGLLSEDGSGIKAVVDALKE